MSSIPLFVIDYPRGDRYDRMFDTRYNSATTDPLGLNDAASLISTWTISLFGFDFIDPDVTQGTETFITIQIEKAQGNRERVQSRDYYRHLYLSKNEYTLIDPRLSEQFGKIVESMTKNYFRKGQDLIKTSNYSTIVNSSLKDVKVLLSTDKTERMVLSYLYDSFSRLVDSVVMRHYSQEVSQMYFMASTIWMYQEMLNQRHLLGCDDLIAMISMFRSNALERERLTGMLTFEMSSYYKGLMSLNSDMLDDVLPKSFKGNKRQEFIDETVKHQALLPPAVIFAIMNLYVSKVATVEKKVSRFNSSSVSEYYLEEPFSRWSTELSYSDIPAYIRQSYVPRMITTGSPGSGGSLEAELRLFLFQVRRMTGRRPDGLKMKDLYTGIRDGASQLYKYENLSLFIPRSSYSFLEFYRKAYPTSTTHDLMDFSLLKNTWLTNAIDELETIGFKMGGSLEHELRSFMDYWFSDLISKLFGRDRVVSTIQFRSRAVTYADTPIGYSNTI